MGINNIVKVIEQELLALHQQSEVVEQLKEVVKDPQKLKELEERSASIEEQIMNLSWAKDVVQGRLKPSEAMVKMVSEAERLGAKVVSFEKGGKVEAG